MDEAPPTSQAYSVTISERAVGIVYAKHIQLKNEVLAFEAPIATDDWELYKNSNTML